MGTHIFYVWLGIVCGWNPRASYMADHKSEDACVGLMIGLVIGRQI